jgi:hypothetical protein
MTDEHVSNGARTGPGWRRPATFLVGALVVAALALPALAADPSPDPSASSSAGTAPSASTSTAPSASPSAGTEASSSVAPVAPVAPAATPQSTASPNHASPDAGMTDEDDEGEDSDKPDKKDKGDKTPEVAITLRGTVAMTKDAKGRPTFSLASGGKTYDLEAGPPWFWGDDNPLVKFAGKTVTIAGETHTGETEIDVLTVDGTAIRAPGKPPWAGGWKVVGEKHPGWSQDKAAKFKAKFGGCFPPGQCKQHDTTPPPPAGVPGGD